MWIVLLLITIVSGILSGMGIGGGAIFIMLSTLFSIFSQKEAQGYNLLMFIVVGIFATISNFKNKVFDKKLFLKIIFPIFIGSIAGMYLAKLVPDNDIRKYFYIFMIIIAIYEIIVSIINMKKSKNNSN